MLKQQNNYYSLHWDKPEQLVFCDPGGPVTADEWLRQLAAVINYCQQQSGENVLLFHTDSYSFSLWFCALAYCGGHIILAPNAQPDTLALANRHADWQVPQQLPETMLQSEIQLEVLLDKRCHVSFFTSGSTGEPKLIQKNLQQLFIEVLSLHQHFSTCIPNDSIFVATVSHQHIYGLLFRILWPLSHNMPIYRPQIAYFEQWQQLLQQHKLVLVASPAHLSRFDELSQLSNVKPQISAIFSSGGPLSDHLPALYQHHTGQAPVEIFGSTETGGIAYRQRQQTSQPWRAFDDITLQQSDNGCLVICSPYVNNKQPYQTQDQVNLLGEQYLEVLGRADRIVKIEEKRLSLPELEQYCLQHPYITAAAALVLTMPKRRLALVLQLSKQGYNLCQSNGKRWFEQMLKDYLLTRFERVLLPKKYRYVTAMPYNEQGKLPVARLEALFSDD